jgi:hypothetical protein
MDSTLYTPGSAFTGSARRKEKEYRLKRHHPKSTQIFLKRKNKYIP